MLELEQLRSDHADAVLAFELANREHFAASITDRGDQFYEQFFEHFRALLAEQDAGLCAFYVLVDDDGSVVGRFNLYDLRDGAADVGYRLDQRVAGRGVATSTLLELCRLAEERHGLTLLQAKTRNENAASRRVLEKAGFVAMGPTEVGGQHGTAYELEL